MTITGSGFINGNNYEMSSSRGEYKGQLVLAIMVNYLFSLHNLFLPVTFICDNQVVITSCQNNIPPHIRHHRGANMDMQLEFQHQTQHLNIKHKWVKGHQDNIRELNDNNHPKENCLPIEALLNIHCDKLAALQHNAIWTDFSASILPSE